MYWSKYNILFESTQHSCYLLYNMLSGFFIEVDKDLFNTLNEIRHNGNLDSLSPNQFQVFVGNKVLVKSDEDELNKLKVSVLAQRYDMRKINLTIAPTRDCNFKCVYCFEKDRPTIYMNSAVEDGIVKLVKEKNVDIINVCWYGGEPLMAKDIIKRLTTKLKSLGKKYSASIITNGYLLDNQFISNLDELSIKVIQITIDGNKETHNNRRPHKIDLNGFDKIINNIRLLVKIRKNIHLSVRVNVDKNNMGEFVDVYKLIKDINANIYVYPGFVHDSSSSCKSSMCMSEKDEKKDFFIHLYSRHGIYLPDMVPNLIISSCMARCLNSYLIGPDGNIYKCWHHLGVNNLVVGNVLLDKIFTNHDVIARYMKGEDYLDDDKCKKCKYSVICGGGCPDLRLNNSSNERNDTYCSIFKNNIHSFLDIKYSNL